MDSYQGIVLERGARADWAEEIRTALGLARQIAGRIDLVNCIPSGHLSSSGYCLAHQGKEYLVYVPDDQPVNLDLGEVHGKFRSTWFSTLDGREEAGQVIEGGRRVMLSSPFQEGEAMIHLKR
jgi:hypothetical protein